MILGNSFIDQEHCVNMLAILGWVGPLLVILPYICYRILYENEKCWMDTG